MLEDLFITETPGGISTSGIELPESIEDWPVEIQNIINTQIPALAQIPGQLNFDAVDQDKLYAKGAYTVHTTEDGRDPLIFPVLIKNGELAPMDVFLYKGDFRPVDNDDISAILMSPELGDQLISEQDIPASAYSNFSNRVTPPGAYGSGYVNSYASKTGSVNDKLINLISKNPSIKRNLMLNKTAQQKFIHRLDDADSLTQKAASSFNPINGSHVVYALGNGKFSVKSASLYNGEVAVGHTECTGDDLVKWCKEAGVNIPRLLSELRTNGLSFTWDTPVSEKTAEAADKAITSLGAYTCYTKRDASPVTVDIIGYVKTASGDKRFLALGENGTYTLQRALYGKEAAQEKTAGCITVGIPKIGELMTVQLSEDGEFAPPTLIKNITQFRTKEASGVSVSGNSCNGKVAFVFLEDSGLTQPLATKYVPEACFVEKGASAWYVPAEQIPVKLSKEIPLASSAKEHEEAKFLKTAGKSSTTLARFWKASSDRIAFKLGASAPVLTDKTSALILMHQLDNQDDVLTSMNKIAAGAVKTIDMNNSKVSEETKKTPACIRKIGEKCCNKQGSLNRLTDEERLSILKVASAMDDGETIDTVLALNYVNPENTSEFIENLPELKKTENMLAKLVLSTRLGNSIVEEQDVQNVLGSLHELIKNIESRS